MGSKILLNKNPRRNFAAPAWIGLTINFNTLKILFENLTFIIFEERLVLP